MHHTENSSPYNPTTEPIIQPGGGIAYTPAQPVTIHPGTSVHVFTAAARVGPEPCTVTCHVCNETSLTRVEKGAGTRTHLMALALCFFGCWCCAPCVYCIDACLCTKHYCSKCNTFIGVYNAELI